MTGKTWKKTNGLHVNLQDCYILRESGDSMLHNILNIVNIVNM